MPTFERGRSDVEEKNELPNCRIGVQRAFVSAHDKGGLLQFAAFLVHRGIELYATEGTASYLRAASIDVRPADELTGFAELLSGKVKSLSPRLHAGILFSRASSKERAKIEKQGVLPIDMVVVNFYPFHKVTDMTPLEEATKMIDIGGPAALRAAAKNSRWVVPVPEPGSYERVMEDMLREESTAATGENTVSLQLSLELAALTFSITSNYDSLVQTYLSRQSKALRASSGPVSLDSSPFPEEICLKLRKIQGLRYGENPHQGAGFYVSCGKGSFLCRNEGALSWKGMGIGQITGIEGRETEGGTNEGPRTDEVFLGRQLQGKELSFNNLLDLDSAVSACREFEAPSCVIIKHRSPCGASQSRELLDAYVFARDCDPLSAFGGVIAVNRPLTETVATEMSKLFLELVAAPSFESNAIETFARKKNLRVIELSPEALARDRTPRALLRSGPGGVLFQEEDDRPESPSDWRLVSRREATVEEQEGLFFLWKVARHVVSNAIVIGRRETTLGIGAGQTSRIDAVEIALMKAKRAGHDTRGTWLASDGFFPFRDSIDLAVGAGIRAIVQPGGSIRDEECIKAADEHGIAMYFTGRRCFKH